MIDALFDVLAVIGGIVVAIAALLVFIAWRFHRAEQRRKRDQAIAQTIRVAGMDAATADDPLWQHFPSEKRQQNGHVPEGWTL